MSALNFRPTDLSVRYPEKNVYYPNDTVDSESFERIICLELIGKLSTGNVT